MENPIVERMRAVLSERREKNPRYGLRALARQLGVPAPTLSRILAGRRGLSLAMARKIVRGLTDHAGEQRRLLKSFALEPKKGTAKPTRYRYLSLGELAKLNHWGHSAILEVLRGEQGIRAIPTIARATGLTEAEAGKCLKDLEELKLVHRSIKRGWTTKGHHLSSIRWEGEAPWRSIHRGYAERAVKYLENYEREQASVQGITFLVAEGRIDEARERIREFAEELADEMSAPSGGTLYRLNAQLFPLGPLGPGGRR